MSPHHDPQALSLEQLLELDNDAFVRGAYSRLFEREVDPEGMRFYCAELLRGTDKLEILERLAASEEARARGLGRLEGLTGALQRWRRQQGNWNRLLRHLSGVQADGLARRVRGLEQLLRQVGGQVDASAAEAKGTAAELMSQVLLIADSVAAGPQAKGTSASDGRSRSHGPVAVARSHKVLRMKKFLGDL